MPPFGKRVGLKHLRPAFAHPPSPVSNDTVHYVNFSPDDGGNAHVHGSKNKQQELSDNNFGENDKENEPPSTSSPLNASVVMISSVQCISVPVVVFSNLCNVRTFVFSNFKRLIIFTYK
jgi:hypothetical protein